MAENPLKQRAERNFLGKIFIGTGQIDPLIIVIYFRRLYIDNIRSNYDIEVCGCQ